MQSHSLTQERYAKLASTGVGANIGTTWRSNAATSVYMSAASALNG